MATISLDIKVRIAPWVHCILWVGKHAPCVIAWIGAERLVRLVMRGCSVKVVR